jgi:hypothetical protein
MTAGPTDFNLHHFCIGTKSEVEPFAGLREECVAGSYGLNQNGVWLSAVGCRSSALDHNAGADGVAVRLGALQSKGHVCVVCAVRAGGDRGVAHQSQSRTGAISEPYVQVAVLIPIGNAQRPAVISEVQTGDRRYVRKLLAAAIQVHAVGFVTAERVALPEQAVGGLPRIAVGQE